MRESLALMLRRKVRSVVRSARNLTTNCRLTNPRSRQVSTVSAPVHRNRQDINIFEHFGCVHGLGFPCCNRWDNLSHFSFIRVQRFPWRHIDHRCA